MKSLYIRQLLLNATRDDRGVGNDIDIGVNKAVAIALQIQKNTVFLIRDNAKHVLYDENFPVDK